MSFFGWQKQNGKTYSVVMYRMSGSDDIASWGNGGSVGEREIFHDFARHGRWKASNLEVGVEKRGNRTFSTAT